MGPLVKLVLSVMLGLVNSQKPSVLHLSSDTHTGAIVKTFPHDLPGLNLLPSTDSDKFYLLRSGDLMLARPIDCLAGSNLSLALTHHILNQTVLHLLSVRVVEAEQLLQFSRAESVMSVLDSLVTPMMCPHRLTTVDCCDSWASTEHRTQNNHTLVPGTPPPGDTHWNFYIATHQSHLPGISLRESVRSQLEKDNFELYIE